MPVYYFNVLNEIQGVLTDCDGTELPDAQTAKREAMRLAGMMIAESASAERYPETWHVGVTGHDGTALFNLDFTIRPSPARPARHLPSAREARHHGIDAG